MQRTRIQPAAARPVDDATGRRHTAEARLRRDARDRLTQAARDAARAMLHRPPHNLGSYADGCERVSDPPQPREESMRKPVVLRKPIETRKPAGPIIEKVHACRDRQQARKVLFPLDDATLIGVLQELKEEVPPRESERGRRQWFGGKEDLIEAITDAVIGLRLAREARLRRPHEKNPRTGEPQVWPYDEASSAVLEGASRLRANDRGENAERIRDIAASVREHRKSYERGHTPDCIGDLYRGLCH